MVGCNYLLNVRYDLICSSRSVSHVSLMTVEGTDRQLYRETDVEIKRVVETSGVETNQVLPVAQTNLSRHHAALSKAISCDLLSTTGK